MGADHVHGADAAHRVAEGRRAVVPQLVLGDWCPVVERRIVQVQQHRCGGALGELRSIRLRRNGRGCDHLLGALAELPQASARPCSAIEVVACARQQPGHPAEHHRALLCLQRGRHLNAADLRRHPRVARPADDERCQGRAVVLWRYELQRDPIGVIADNFEAGTHVGRSARGTDRLTALAPWRHAHRALSANLEVVRRVGV
mmetsp:Transcript_112103/g.323836  ORF Transcript_112103/g.323836 Transcript_112103/m.323836 type:complete len:202 (+) Transcript_112103:2992-3597(+)